MIVILSPDKDFAPVVAEQAGRTLGISCQVAENPQKAKDFLAQAALVIAAEPLEADFACPTLIPKSRPFRLQDLLDEAAIILQKQAPKALRLGAFLLDTRQKQLQCSGKTVALTDKEMQLLECLHRAGGSGVGREQLLKAVWGIEAVLDTHTLETHIYRLRGKFRELSGDDGMIAAVEGGYKLVV